MRTMVRPHTSTIGSYGRGPANKAAENNNNGVEIVDHASSQKPVSSMSKAELKKFMVSLPFLPFSGHLNHKVSLD